MTVRISTDKANKETLYLECIYMYESEYNKLILNLDDLAYLYCTIIFILLLLLRNVYKMATYNFSNDVKVGKSLFSFPKS